MELYTPNSRVWKLERVQIRPAALWPDLTQSSSELLFSFVPSLGIVSWSVACLSCFFLLTYWWSEVWDVYCCNVCMFCQDDTKKLEHSPAQRSSLFLQTLSNICFSEVNFLLVGAVMNIGWENKLVLIVTRTEQLRSWTCTYCILIQSPCTAFSEGKLIVIPFSLNTMQLTRQTLFMSSLRSQWELLHSRKYILIGLAEQIDKNDLLFTFIKNIDKMILLIIKILIF